ncbi:MAG: methyl-accepting chemotaxis protein [Magnetococcales bacterium]|nr:methyl-accepting chemotaxis protein [Magnetococcales bacterium]
MIGLRDIPLRPKLTVLLFVTGLLPLLLLWWLERQEEQTTLLLHATSRIEAARNAGSASIKRYFAERRADMEALAQLTAERYRLEQERLETLRDLKRQRIESLLAQRFDELQRIAGNGEFVKRITALDWIFRQGGRKSDNRNWREGVEGFTPWFERQGPNDGQEDLYYISAQGDIVFSMARLGDLGQNVHQKAWQETGLGKIQRAGLEGPAMLDHIPHAPGERSDSLLFAVPVKKEGSTIGVAVARFSRTFLTRQLHAGVDPGQMIDLYLTAGDGLRTDSLLAPTSPTGNPAAWQIALNGKAGSGPATGLHGQPVLAGWAPVRVRDLQWAIIVERDLARLFVPQGKEQKGVLQKFSDSGGYYDLFLIHPDGKVFFTAARQADFATNLLTGQYADTNLGQLFKRVLESRQFGMSDLLPYPPSDNQPAYFMAQPLIEHDKVAMVMAMQLPPDAISGIMQQVANSGEVRAFLVGPDRRLRTDAFANPAQPAPNAAFVGGPSTPLVNPLAVENALSGQTGSLTGIGGHGERIVTAFAPLPLDNFTWAVVAETAPEAMATGAHPLRIPLILLAWVGLLTLAGSVFIRTELVTPLHEAFTLLKRLASGRFAHPSASDRKDELGVLTRLAGHVADELAQAGQRIQVAAEPLVGRIRRLASLAMAISRESAQGSELIGEARREWDEMSRQQSKALHRLEQEHAQAVAAQAALARNAVDDGKRELAALVASWRPMIARIQELRQVTGEIQQTVLPQPEVESLPGKPKRKELLARIATLTQTLRNDLEALERMSASPMETVERVEVVLKRLDLPEAAEPIPTSGEHPLEPFPLPALEKLENLLKQNVASAREIVLGAKAIFDITTGALRQSTSFFALDHPADAQQGAAQPAEAPTEITHVHPGDAPHES